MNGRPVSVRSGWTLLQACEAAAVEMPRFCYHEGLLVAGNCRRCLVEVAGAPKPVASCARPVAPGRVVWTNSPLVHKAREGRREFLLANHPLDCPVCDQGGECDLQDQARIYGSDRSRFFGRKRSVEAKDFGPLVKTVRTRCIACTRCVRFASEVAGFPGLGASGRGRDVEMGRYVDKPFFSELSGNVVDLCPVGALTSKPGAFVSRPWELTTTSSHDVTSAELRPIRLQTRGGRLRRVQPELGSSGPQEWLSDRARYSVDALGHNRMSSPTFKADGAWSLRDRSGAQAVLGQRLESVSCVEVVASSSLDSNTVRDSMEIMGDRQEGGSQVTFISRSSLFNCSGRSLAPTSDSRASLEESDLMLRVGVNPRREAPSFNAAIRRAYLSGGCHRGYIGAGRDLTYPATHLGLGLQALESLIQGDHPFSSLWKGAEKPFIIVGSELVRRASWETRMYPALLDLRGNLSQEVPQGGGQIRRLPKHVGDLSVYDLCSREQVGYSEGNSSHRPWSLGIPCSERVARIYIGVSAGEVAEAGYVAEHLLGQATWNIALASHGDSWTNGRDLVLPRGTTYETGGFFRSRFRGDVEAVPAVGCRPLGAGGATEVLAWRLDRAPVGLNPPLEVEASEPLSVSGGCPWTPATVDFYREGHVLAENSPTLARASVEARLVQGVFR